jgi:hypothetical protein
VALQTRTGLKFDSFAGVTVAIDWDAQFLLDRCESCYMVGVFVRDQNRGEVLGPSADDGQTFANLAQTEAGINQDASFVGFNIGAIAGRSATENGEANRHDES